MRKKCVFYQCSIVCHDPLSVAYYDIACVCVCFLTGDKVVLKKSCNGGFVVEYIGYVIEVL